MGGEADLAEAARIGYETRKRHRVLTNGQLALLEAGAAFAAAAAEYDAASAETLRLSGPDADRGPEYDRAFEARKAAGERRHAADAALGRAALAAYAPETE